MINGKCMCGGITFSIEGDLPTHDGPIPMPVYCHCKICQRATGAAFSVAAMVSTSQLQWLSGEELIKSYSSSPGVLRSFCSECGSTLSYRDENYPDDIHITLGIIDEPFDYKPKAHIFVASKASWYECSPSARFGDLSGLT